jgi:hypothetical protein
MQVAQFDDLCKVAELDLYVGLVSRAGPLNPTSNPLQPAFVLNPTRLKPLDIKTHFHPFKHTSWNNPHHETYFFVNYTIHRRHSQRTHTHPYEYAHAHANPTPMSIFKDCAGKSSRLTKSPHAPRYRRERHLPLKAQMSLNPEKFAPTGSRTTRPISMPKFTCTFCTKDGSEKIVK